LTLLYFYFFFTSCWEKTSCYWLHWEIYRFSFVVLYLVCYRSVRCSAYEALSTWIRCLGASCGTETFAGDVIRHCLSDCTPSADSLKVAVLAS